jgi:hypothetical protein
MKFKSPIWSPVHLIGAKSEAFKMHKDIRARGDFGEAKLPSLIVSQGVVPP